jgi:transcriptional regulator with XRE-family HTH domain
MMPRMTDERGTPPITQQFYANWVRNLRETAGYTQQALAKKMGVHRSFVSHIESGKRVISVDTIGQFRLALIVEEAEKSPYRQRVAARLQNARLKISPRLSQEALAEMAGFSVGYVAKVENASVSTTVVRLERLASSLNIEISELLDDLP